MRIIRGALVSVSLLLLSACGQSAASPSGTDATTGEPSATDCGTFTLTQNERPPGSAIQCFVGAVREGVSARLKVTSPTEEGDPIPVTYSSRASGQIEIIRDSRQDNWAARTDRVVTSQMCTLDPSAPADTLRFTNCTDPIAAPK